MTMTYTNAIKSYRDRAETNLKSLKTYIEKRLIKSNTTKDSETPILLKADGVEQFGLENLQYEPETVETNDFTEHGKERFLLSASDCENGGIFTTAKVNIYTCDGKVVTKAQYDGRNGAGCSITERVENVCYCSYEYHGDHCEGLIAYTCEIERVNYPVQCKGTDSYEYVYSYDGVPPCYTVESGETITMT